tara:strand:- start:837 stop:1034 length:198 start_codon:yes stop_codon:yes gene_type:complete
MAKSISGVNERAGKVKDIGDNRYGHRESYDDAAKAADIKKSKEGDDTVSTFVNNPLQNKVTRVVL